MTGFSARLARPLLGGRRARAVALVGLLRPARYRPRHSPTPLRGSPYGRESGWGFAPIFFRLAHCLAGHAFHGFPLVRLPKVCP